jgi:MraZ protein
VFRGRFEHAIDAKGRVSLPARYRETLTALRDDLLVITKSDEPCLRAYARQAFREFEEKLAQKPSLDPRVRRVTRHFVGSAQDCQVDGMGRVLIIPELRDYAGLAREVVFVGQIKFIEIWAKDRWVKANAQVLESLSADQQALADLGI